MKIDAIVINNLPLELKIRLYNKLSDNPVYCMDELDKVLEGYTPSKIIELVSDEFCIQDEYFGIYQGKLYSQDSLSLNELLEDELYIMLSIYDLQAPDDMSEEAQAFFIYNVFMYRG